MTSDSGRDTARLWAVSDLHVAHAENRAIVDRIEPRHPDDWLIVAGDVGELFTDVLATLKVLAGRFAKVVWSPGNHELWSHPKDPVKLRGEERYLQLVEGCREFGVLTPEDEYPVWKGGSAAGSDADPAADSAAGSGVGSAAGLGADSDAGSGADSAAGPADGGPVVIAPLFLLYDYSFMPDGARTPAEGLAIAEAAGIVCTDEFLLHPDPYESRQAWCQARVAYTEARLSALPPGTATVLVNHWPLHREPTRILRYPEFAQWCGTEATADWHTRFGTVDVVYGHLHIPRRTVYDGVRFTEVSLGYPREWSRRPPSEPLRQILPPVSGL